MASGVENSLVASSTSTWTVGRFGMLRPFGRRVRTVWSFQEVAGSPVDGSVLLDVSSDRFFPLSHLLCPVTINEDESNLDPPIHKLL